MSTEGGGRGAAAGADLGELLAACADEPIHVPEAIQPFGVAVLVDRHGVVRARSSEPEEILGRAVPLGEQLAAVLGGDLAERVDRGASPFAVAVDGTGTLDVVVHDLGGPDGLRLVEVEPVADEDLPADELIARQRPLWTVRSLDQLLDLLVAEVRSLTGFDRVMAYRFDEDWNGEVVAEACAPGLDPYLGLRYPASDIPAQARELYRRNPSRLIADVDYRPSPLQHEDEARTAPLDLSASGLRSVSPVHLQYLRNMGVAASMSLSLLVEGRLWGLVACHHLGGPRRPDPRRRRAATALAELASALMVSVAEAEQLAERVLAAEQVGALRSRLEAAEDPLSSLVDGPALLEVVGAVGAVVCIDGRLAQVGDTPLPEDAREDAAVLLGRAAPVPVARTEEALARPHGDLVGAMATPLGGAGRSWIAWYRPELVHEVRWAGDPRSDEVLTDADGRARLGPRRSFDTFVESVRGRCRPWTAGDRWAGTEVGHQLGAVLTRRTHERLAAAVVVQRALLLDTEVSAPGFDVAVRYLPAHGDPIGGDWHDVFLLPDGSTAFVVGDAVGHGVEVAGVMAQLRNALRAYLVAGSTPSRALGRLDDLIEQLLPGQMATAAVCVVSPGEGRLRVASAGHLPPFLVGRDGVAPLALDGMPALGLGLARKAATQAEVDAVVASGEGLVLFTDGLVERRGESMPARLETVRAAIEDLGASAGAEALCDRAVASMVPDGSDDLTVVAWLRSEAGRG